MRERIEQKKKADGPLDIRIRVWLTVFGLVLVCLLSIGLIRNHTSRPARDTAALLDQNSSTRQTSFPRMPQREFTPAAYDSGASSDIGETQLTVSEQATQDRRTWMDNSE